MSLKPSTKTAAAAMTTAVGGISQYLHTFFFQGSDARSLQAPPAVVLFTSHSALFVFVVSFVRAMCGRA